MLSEEHSSPKIITLEKKKATKKSVSSWCWEHYTIKNTDKTGKDKYTFDNDGQNSFVECNVQVEKWVRDKENLFAPKKPVSQPCGSKIKLSRGSTTGILNHFRSAHNLEKFSLE